MFQNISISITAIISIISIILSVATYWNKKPKLKIEISDKKWDCFFGNAFTDEAKMERNTYIGGAKIMILNNSPVSITISNINMLIGKEKLDLIGKDIPYWKEIMFCFVKDGELVFDGSVLNYSECGISLPYKIEAYDSIETVVLFYNFPKKNMKKCKSKIVLNTAIGKVKKTIKMIEYDENYLEKGYRDYSQYQRSLDIN